MATQIATPQTLLGTLQPQSRTAQALFAVAVTVLGTVLLTVSAKIAIPFIPVPATFQSMTVAVLAAAFGWRIGVATVALYIAQGLAGLPVFAGGGGVAYVFSPTFGFIVGWLVMAFAIGWAADRGLSQKILPLFAVMIAGDALSFVFGYSWLVAMSGGAAWIDQANVLGSAFAAAVEPFIVWDILKMAFAALTVAGGWALLSGRKSA